MADYRANVEDMDGVITDKLFEEVEVEFEDIMELESFNEKVQSDNTGGVSDLSEDNTDHRREICAAFRNPCVEHFVLNIA